MKTLSVCLIVKNEERTLENCLSSIKSIADEIVIIDTGSNDDTKIIAKKFSDKVYDFVWCDDFSKARNYSFCKATCDYIMWLDADDQLLEKDADAILRFKEDQTSPDVVMLKYVTAFDENFNEEFCFYRERILKRSANFVWQDPVHEVIVPRGEIVYLNASVYHMKKETKYIDRNLKIYEGLKKRGEPLSPRQQFYYARELYFNNKIDEAIVELDKFLSSCCGWVENEIEACLNIAKCYEIKKDYSSALAYLFKSFAYTTPRGEILCEIGDVFLNLKRYDDAIYWYKLARATKPNLNSGAFVRLDNYNFIPALQLCVCYFYKGDIKRSRIYHNITKRLKPYDKSVVNNENFFRNLKINKKHQKNK